MENSIENLPPEIQGYVRDLRKESGKYRTRANEAEEKLEKAMKDLEGLKAKWNEKEAETKQAEIEKEKEKENYKGLVEKYEIELKEYKANLTELQKANESYIAKEKAYKDKVLEKVPENLREPLSKLDVSEIETVLEGYGRTKNSLGIETVRNGEQISTISELAKTNPDKFREFVRNEVRKQN